MQTTGVLSHHDFSALSSASSDEKSKERVAPWPYSATDINEWLSNMNALSIIWITVSASINPLHSIFDKSFAL